MLQAKYLRREEKEKTANRFKKRRLQLISSKKLFKRQSLPAKADKNDEKQS